jgi:hypothetical protein
MKDNTLIPIQLTPTHLVCLSVKKKGPSIYTVDPVKRTCNCDDWWYRGGLCKHLRAALATPPLPAERLGDILPL